MTIEYILLKDDDGNIVPCDACEEAVPTSDFDDRRDYSFPRKTIRLCDVCASTRSGTAFTYPNQMTSADVIKTVAACTNKILQALKEAK